MTQGYIARGPFNPPGTAYRASLGPGLSLWVNPGSEMRSSDNACYRTLAPIKPATTRAPRVRQGLSGQGGGIQSVAVPVRGCATNPHIRSRQKSGGGS